nr:carboxypeptidase-like regulatory domain-containing protein [bacterium]
MAKRFLSLLLMVSLLLCAAPKLSAQAPSLSTARINALQDLAGEDGAQWREGTPPSPDMNAFQMWQWTDWFLSNRVRSLLGALQDYEQLEPDIPLNVHAESDQWQLREMENTLSRFEAQLEEDRLAILNGIRLFQSSEASDAERLAAYNRISEAENEIKQIIKTICRDYQTYLESVNNCINGLQTKYGSYTHDVHTNASDSLAKDAEDLENSENSATTDFSVSVISTHQFCIRVFDPDKTPISGATVTVSNPLNQAQKQATTDAQGEAIFWVGDLGADEKSELLLNLHLEAGGYRTREVQTVRLRSGETRSVDLQKDDGTPYLIMGCFNGKDILTESNSYYYTQKNTANLAFTVKLHCTEDGELELRYPVDVNATEYKTVVNKFTTADSDKTVLKFEDQWLSKLLPGAKVSFTIKAGGQNYTTDTLLVIQKALVEEPFFSKSALFSLISGSNSVGFNIPSNIPFIGGSRLSIDILDNLPQAVYLPSYSTLFSWGYDFKPEQANWQTQDAEDEARAIKEFEVKGKADEALALAGAYRNINATTQSKLLGNYGAYVTPFASLLGLYRTSNHTLELRGTSGATMAFNAEITQTFTIGPVPFFAGADFNMGAGFGLDVTSDTKLDVIGGVPTVVEDPKIGYESEKSVSFRTDLGTTLGMASKDVESVAFRGYGCLNPIVRFTTSKVTAEASADMGFDVTLRTLFFKWSKTLWEGKLPLSQSSTTAPGASNAQALQLNFAGAEESKLAEPNSQAGSEGLEPSSTEKLFSQLDVAADDLQFVEIGGQTYLFWIKPGTDGQAARLHWYNLNDTSKQGEVSFLVGKNSGLLLENKSMDYAFALEAGGDFCALTILSGNFPKATTGDEPVTPSKACVATVLMRRCSDEDLDEEKLNTLEMIGYQEEAVLTQSGDYPVMPEVRLLENNGEISVLSTYSTADNPERIDSQLYAYRPQYSDNTGAKLQKAQSQACKDEAAIVRYHIATATASGQQTALYTLNADGKLSRLTTGRDVLAQGNIINFQVLTGAGSGHSTDRLFYLERVELEKGKYTHRLKSVTLDPVLKITDYDIETSASFFDIVRFDEGVYLYWTECSTPNASSNIGDIREEYLVRCIRYDPDTDTAYGPFSLVQLGETPSSIKLLDSGTGYYSVDLQSSQGSYLRQSLSRFNYGPIASAEMTAAVLSDPCVCAGDYTDLVFSVKNTGNVPISALDIRIMDEAANNAEVQTLHIDLDNPEFSINTYRSQNAVYTMTGANAMRRIGNMYDPLNQENWTITDTTAAGTTTRSVRTDLLMPGDTHSYQIKLQIPADWKGGKTLVAQIVDVTGETALLSQQTAESLLLIGAPQTGSAAHNQLTVRLGSETAKGIDTDAHDLMLSAQLFQRSGEDYVHITIRNRSGNTESDVTPSLTASYRGETLYSHAFLNPMGDDFGYSMDIPLKTLTQDRRLQELELHVGDTNDTGYEDFADSDNHVRLLLIAQLCIIDQPQSISASAGDEVAFSVTAACGEKPYRYQWQRMTQADQWEDIPGADLDTYRIESVKDEQHGLTVRCVVTDQFGDSVTSDSATLSTLPPTGDSSQLTLWLLLAISSVAVLAMVCLKRYSR